MAGRLGTVAGLILRVALASAPVILETGGGNTTIMLAYLSPAQHIVVCRDGAVIDRTRKFCQSAAVPTTHFDIHIGFSEWLLPELAGKSKECGPFLSFGLIDGGHNWPTVFIDFFYINFMLREGGYLMIDDLQLHSVKELGRFLAEEPGFELAFDLEKSLVFKKTTAARTLGGWKQSPYIVRRSNENMRQSDPFAI